MNLDPLPSPIEVRLVGHNSPEYLLAVELRRRILRQPLGLDFSVEELGREERETHIVALDGNHLVGCLVMVPQNCSVVKMRQVAVEPELQGKGVGTKMVRASEQWARDSGFTQLELNARDTAVNFYLGLEYRIIGEPFVEVTIPHRRMIKDLV